jgi:hypothetical protein
MEAVADAYGEVIHLYDRRYLVKKYLLNIETICFHKSDFFYDNFDRTPASTPLQWVGYTL